MRAGTVHASKTWQAVPAMRRHRRTSGDGTRSPISRRSSLPTREPVNEPGRRQIDSSLEGCVRRASASLPPVRDNRVTLIYLIGGPARCGKTELALRLLRAHSLPIFSTHVFGAFMKDLDDGVPSRPPPGPTTSGWPRQRGSRYAASGCDLISQTWSGGCGASTAARSWRASRSCPTASPSLPIAVGACRLSGSPAGADGGPDRPLGPP